MASKAVFIVLGLGAKSAGQLGRLCPTWPDCDAGIPWRDPANPSQEYDDTGYTVIQGMVDFTAIGGTVFETDFEARGWLEFDPAGIAFKEAFLNVLVLRTSVRA